MALKIAFPSANTPPLSEFFPATGTYEHPADLVAVLVRLLPTPALCVGSGGVAFTGGKDWFFVFSLPGNFAAGRYTLLVADPVRGVYAHVRVKIAKKAKGKAGLGGFPDPTQPLQNGNFGVHDPAYGATGQTTPPYRSYFIYDDGITPNSHDGTFPPGSHIPQGWWAQVYDNLVAGKTATFHIEDSATPKNVKEVTGVQILGAFSPLTGGKNKKKKKSTMGTKAGKKKKK
jgi:hypothetical protein